MLDFGGGALSGVSGLLLLGQLNRRLGLMRKAGNVLDEFAHTHSKIRHLVSNMFRPRVLSLAAGYKGPNDQAEFSKAPLPQSAVVPDGGLG